MLDTISNINLIDFIRALKKKQVELRLVNGKLSIRMHGQKLADADISEIRERREEIIALLKKNAGTVSEVKANSTICLYEEQDFYSISYAQRRLWIVEQLNPSVYNMPYYFKFDALDKPSFEKALRALIDRHEILRTNFVTVEGEQKQRVHPEVNRNFNVKYVDLQNSIDTEADVRHEKQQDARKPFDLEKDSLMRVTVLKIAAEKHIVIVNIHHIIFDGWSAKVLNSDFTYLYQHYLGVQSEALKPLSIHYKDYTCWQLDQSKTPEWDRTENYWKKQFEKEIPDLSLVTDRVRPKARNFDGEGVSFIIEENILKQIQAICRQQGATIFMALIAVTKILLHRYTGTEDIVLGSPIAGRDRVELEDQLGFYVNTLALRTEVAGNDSFVEILQKVKEVTLNAYDNQQYPYNLLVEDSGLARDMSRTPLFDVLALLHNKQTEKIDENDPTKNLFNVEKDVLCRFDLSFNYTECANALLVELNYSKDIFDEDRMVGMAKHLKQLLISLLQQPNMPVSVIDYINSVEKQNVLFNFNNRGTIYPGDRSIPRLFELQVAKSPDATAIVFGEERMTYQELSAQSTLVCNILKKKFGIQPGNLVAIIADRSPKLIILIMAVLKAGAGYIPLDPTYPADRLKFMIDDTMTPLLIADKNCEHICADWHCPITRIVDIDDLLVGTDESISSAWDEEISTDSVAYVMYTSGSTGKPKGVVVTHRGVVRLVKNTDYIALSHKDRLLQTGSISFDATTFEYYSMLLNGGQLHLLSSAELFNPERLKEKMYANGITMIWITSSWLNQLVDQDIRLFSRLNTLLVGGEKLSAKHINLLRDRYPSLNIINGYGPTENTTFSTCKLVDRRYEDDIPLGKPISNSTVYLLDRKLNPVPIGVAGEIYLGGDGLAAGYLNQPELTHELFIDNPFQPGNKMYKSGDLGCWMGNGEVRFLTRKDDQVKIRGYRIEPGEIESVLIGHHCIDQVAVVALSHRESEKFLVAYYSGRETAEIEIKKYLESLLPSYMIPSNIVYLPNLPLTPNGKIDKNKLLAVGFKRTSRSAVEFVPPTGEIEQGLADIWKEVLNVDSVSATDSFFELGGHSLKATLVIAKIYKIFTVEIGLSDVFEKPVLREFAAFIAATEKGHYEDIEPVEEQEHYAISHAQQRLWVVEQFEEAKGVYNILYSILFENLNRQNFERSIINLVDRHQALRTSFVVVDGEPRQRIRDIGDSGFSINYIDLRGVNLIEEQVKKIKEGEELFVFDLVNGPLIRVTLIHLYDETYRVVINLHHIISDGWSSEVLAKEFSDSMDAFSAGKESPLQPLLFQYKDYSCWQQHKLENGFWDKHKNFWHKHLDNLTPLELPTDYARPAMRSYQGEGTSFVLDETITKKLLKYSEQESATPFMTLLACVKLLFFKYTGQEDIVVGTVVAGRERVELENQLGFFVNTLILRSKFNSGDSFKTLLQTVKQTTIDAYGNQQYPFDMLVDELDHNRNMSRSPFFDVVVDMQNFGGQHEFGKLPAFGDPYEFDPVLIKFDLNFTFIETAKELVVNLNYSVDLFTRDKIEQLINHFVQLLYAVVEDSSVKISEIDYLSEKEKQQLTYDFNQVEENDPPQKTLLQLFDEQVRLNPGQVVVMDKKEQYSYQQVDEQANKIANYLLQNLSVQKGEYIGIIMKPSSPRIFAMLGILKAGCVYVPIDAEYPVSRITYILDDTKTRVLFTDKNTDAAVPTGYVENIVEISENCVEFLAYSKQTPVTISDPLNDVFCVLYTSGSTGIPKGVYIENCGVVNRIDWMWKKYSFSEKDVIYQKTAYVFDVSMGEIFMPLTYGAKLLIADSNNSQEICENIQQFNVTYIHFSPTLLNNFLSGVDEQAIEKTSSLRYFFASGEELLREIVKKYYDRFNIPLINLYGPTEASIEVSYYETRKTDDAIPIGRPIANVQLYVLDKYNQIVPVGVAGEVVIGGVAVSLGYLNQEEKTRERFMPDIFNSRSAKLLYKTGDIGRWNKDGQLEFMGRKDNQISINGLRIELGEIESAIHTHTGIADVAVGFRKNTANHYQLITHYVKSDLSKNMVTDSIDDQYVEISPDEWNQIEAVNSQTVKRSAEPLYRKFEEATLKYSKETALVCGTNSLSYGDLNSKANQLARYMQTRYDARMGDRIAILMERSEHMIVAILAALKLGLTYVPVDTDYPQDRIDFILKDASVSYVLTNIEFTSPFIKSNNVIQYGRSVESASELDNGNLNANSDNEGLLYIMYTSGSTGKPKGVMISERSVTDYVQTFTDFFEVTSKDIVIQQASISFDTSVEEIFPILCAGGKLIVLQAGGRDVEAMMQVCIDHRVSLLSTTPLVVNEINSHINCSKLALRVMISGGDALKASYVDNLLKQLKFYNTYGPTEATVCATFGRVTDPINADIIGLPIANHQIYLLNEKMQEVGFGQKGEICIGGIGLAEGYLNRKTETDKAFVQNPFDGDKRIYKTGDIGLRLQNGTIKFCGRKDSQVKIRGYRIEPSEVEHHILQLGEVNDVCVLSREDRTGSKHLVAFYTSTGSYSADLLRQQLGKIVPMYMVPSYLLPIKEIPKTVNGKVDYKSLALPGELSTDFDFVAGLKEYLKQILPSYMVPGIYMEMEKLPMTATGKIDRKKLAETNFQTGGNAVHVEARSAIERKLVEIWKKMLKKEKISVADNFFELGGNSLKATQIITHIQNELEFTVSINALFNDPTIEGLAANIKTLPKKYKPMEKIISERPYYPVSFAQRRLWVIEQFEEARGAYNMPLCVNVIGLDREVFNKTIYALLDRHEILRTTFAMIGGEPVQKIWKIEDLNFDIEFIDLTTRADATAEAFKITVEDANEPFDLINGPLLRVKLLQLEKEKFRILFNQHHIISDGWSINVLRDDFNKLYDSFFGKKEPSISPLPIQYKEYTLWQKNQFDNGEWNEHQKYWHQQLSGKLPLIDVPADFPRPAQKRYNGAEVNFLVSGEEVSSLQNICRKNGATTFMGLMAAVKILLYRYTGLEDLLIGSPIAGRNRIEFENQLGFYVNTLALRTRFNGADDFETIIKCVKQVMLEAHEHQEYPFDLLVDELGLERDLTRSPLFDIMILHTVEEDSLPYKNGIESKENEISKFDITFNFTETADSMLVSINYSANLYSGERMLRMAGHLKQLIKNITKNPGQAVCTLDLVTPEEQIQLLSDFNGARVGFPNKKTIHRLIEDQVLKTPDAIAVKHGDRSMTYRLLNEKANALAHCLRQQHGVTRNDVIGVMVNRSADLPIVLAAILKAGAAYLPLDPAYPNERLVYMSDDANIKALITDEVVEENADLKLLAGNFEVIRYDQLEASLVGYSTGNPDSVNDPNDLAYLIYTSGTTGKPKGVCLSHLNAVALVSWAKSEFSEAIFDTVFATTSYCFDLSVYEIFYSLTSGKQLRILQDAMEIPYWVEKEKNILINTVPSVMQSLLQQQINLENVNVLNIAGEPIPASVIAGLDTARIEVRNLYGPSEYATYSTCYQFKPGNNEILIGKPLNNTQVYILDNNLKLLPIGIKGDIYIAGEHLSEGYLNRAELTTEKFIDNPFAIGKKLYKTGDVGYWKEDGNIDYIGRSDNQVKLRGYRIELGEVETVLAACAGVNQGAVVVRNSDGEDSQLVAYYTGTETSAESLKNLMKEKLPHFMLPSVFIYVTAFPLSPNGKIDRSALPNPDIAKVEKVFEPPTNKTEEKLVFIWQDILKREQIGISDNFFESGGQSLKAMQIVSRINNELEVSIGIKEVFNHPTIKKLAIVLKNDNAANNVMIKLNKIEKYQKNAFFFPPILGMPTVYSGLSAMLEGELNCYGLMYTPNSTESAYNSIEDLAAKFSTEIEQIQNDGEIILVGYSMGALVAFETAKKLESKNLKLRLVLLDREVKSNAFEDMVAEAGEHEMEILFQGEFGGWMEQMPSKEIDNFRRLFSQNLTLIDKYSASGTINGDIAAVEARGEESTTAMNRWSLFTNGNFNHTFVNGKHTQVLNESNFPLLLNLVLAGEINVMEPVL